MSYIKTNWQNGLTDLNETNLNKIENQIAKIENLSWNKNLTLNSTIFQVGDAKFFQIGNIVVFAIRELVANQDVVDNNTILSGLPKPIETEIFQLNSYQRSETPNSRVTITTNGDLKAHYDTIHASNQYYGQYIYLTSDN